MVQLLLPLALLCSGLGAGGLMISSLGGAPLLLALPTERYIPVHQFLVTRFDPFMPASMLAALLCDAVLVFAIPSTSGQLFAALAVTFLAVAMAVSIRGNVPINRWVATLDPDRVPDNWDQLDPRVRWRNWNVVRTVFAVGALVANALAAAVLL